MCANDELTVQILNIPKQKVSPVQCLKTDSSVNYGSTCLEKKNQAATPYQSAITNQLLTAHAAANINISTESAIPKDNSLEATLQDTQELTTRQEKATQVTTSSDFTTQTAPQDILSCEILTQTAPHEIPTGGFKGGAWRAHAPSPPLPLKFSKYA